jgi:hypothetical protein
MTVKGFKYNLFLSVFALACALAGCTSSTNEPVAENSPEVLAELASQQVEGSGTFSEPPPATQQLAEGSGTKMVDHPELQAEEKVERGVLVPENVKGKWKAVKLLVRDRHNEENNEIKTVDLGSQFSLGKSGLMVTVGPFFPNFVMSKSAYSSMDNRLINPAVQLVVEQNGKVFYKGWAFKKYPTMYAFEHPDYGLELLESIPAEVS